MPETIVYTFDMKYGPKPLYTIPEPPSDPELIKKLGYKIFIGVLGYSQGSSIEIQEFVIPLPDEEKICFFLTFSMSVDNTTIPLVLAVLFESNQQSYVYKIAGLLSEEFRLIAEQLITQKYTSKIFSKIGNNLYNVTEANYLEEKLKQKNYTANLTSDPSQAQPSIMTLLFGLKKGADKLIATLIVGDPAVVILDELAFADTISATLELFCPHRSLVKGLWETQYSDKADLIIGPSELLKSVPKNICVANFTKNKVEGSDSSNYVSNLLKRLQKLSANDLVLVASEYINEFISHLNEINLLCRMDNKSEHEIMSELQDLISTFMEGEAQLLLRLIEKRYSENYGKILGYRKISKNLDKLFR